MTQAVHSLTNSTQLRLKSKCACFPFFVAFSELVMQAVYSSVILAILCTSVVCAIRAQSPKTTGGKSITKVGQSVSKGPVKVLSPVKGGIPCLSWACLRPRTGTKCGISASAPNGGRIVGGDEAKPHSWPWQVLIQCKHVEESCGGSIISDKWVISAAHCFNPTKTDIRRNCKVLIGKHDRKRKESKQLITTIADYFIHEKFNPGDRLNAYDLALFKLPKRLKFTNAIKPICLPFGLPELPYSKRCYAAGWGRTGYYNPEISNTLMQLSMTVMIEQYCDFPDNRIICTAPLDHNNGICKGDSGGPLACQEGDGKWYLRGVLSKGPEKCDLGAISTKVTSFEKWIVDIIKRN